MILIDSYNTPYSYTTSISRLYVYYTPIFTNDKQIPNLQNPEVPSCTPIYEFSTQLTPP